MTWLLFLSKGKWMEGLLIWTAQAASQFLAFSSRRHFLKNLLNSLSEIQGKKPTLIFCSIGFAKRAYSMKMLLINIIITDFPAINLPKRLTRKYLSNGLPLGILYSRPYLL